MAALSQASSHRRDRALDAYFETRTTVSSTIGCFPDACTN
jgi:hypothetical protein